MNRNSSMEPDWPALVEQFLGGLTSVKENVRAALRELAKTACTTLNSAESSFLIPTADGNHLEFFVSVNEELETGSLTVPRDESLAGFVFQTGQMVAVDKPDDYYREIDEKVGTRTQEYIAVPILHEVSTLGVMTFMNRPEGHPGGAFTEKEIDCAQSFAALAAPGLRFYQRLGLQFQLLGSDLTEVREALSPGEETPRLPTPTRGEEMDQTPIVRVLSYMEKSAGRDQEFFADLVEMVAKQIEGEGEGGFTMNDFRE